MMILGENVRNLKLIDSSLRLMVIPLSLASMWLTLTNHQDNPMYGKLEFSNLKGLKLLVSISAISAAYSLAAVISSWIKNLMNKAWVFLVCDQVVAYMMVACGGSIGEIVYLAYNGNPKVTWSEACSSYGRFCGKLNLILVLHFIALLCFLVLSLISAFRVFTRFEPPLAPSKEQEVERT
ncbi:CASP-like protein 2D1 [Cynara cardunculus var. scolymus]|uniref:CASP-like protein 2D1 n=1 Tax=Cynara cardunculus var. scolymus TaxID=59895 RepID=UPI000D6282F2|nr:CASP-like protein 2D1 [Cynara cardunculus var. scolymus]